MSADIRIVTTKRNRIRALSLANPNLPAEALADRIGVDPRSVEYALERGDRRRRKSSLHSAK